MDSQDPDRPGRVDPGHTSWHLPTSACRLVRPANSDLAVCHTLDVGSRRVEWGRKVGCSTHRDAPEGRVSSHCHVFAAVGHSRRGSFLLHMECFLPSTMLVRVEHLLKYTQQTPTLG